MNRDLPPQIGPILEALFTEAGCIAKAIGNPFRHGVDAMYERVVGLARQCESPIEVLLLAALLRESLESESSRLDTIIPQFGIGVYRVDFYLKCEGDVSIVVECDGHEWHERTAEQAQRDKARDRAIQAEGFQVFRFTGREIWRDSQRCAREVFEAAGEEWGRRLARDEEAKMMQSSASRPSEAHARPPSVSDLSLLRPGDPSAAGGSHG